MEDSGQFHTLADLLLYREFQCPLVKRLGVSENSTGHVVKRDPSTSAENVVKCR
jgi:hypothetical protein